MVATRRVLIVDDLEQNRYLLVSLLSGHGYEVTQAANGEEAWALAQSAPPHLIISDLLMPVLDGFELCRRCKSDPRLAAVPFLVYTATYTDPKDEQLALSLGADRYLVKPQAPEVLMEVVRNLLEEADRGHPARSAQGTESSQLLAHNQALIRKLQDKVQQLEREIRRREETELALRQDVTERQRAEDEIRRLNQELEARVLGRTEQLEVANRALGQQRDTLERLAGELRAQNDELGRQKARLAEAHRLQSTFVSSMTHELRTPLNSVITLSGLLSRRLASSIPAEEHGYLDVIERNGRGLLETINGVLDYARLEAGREQPRPERFELAPLVQEVASMLEPQAREKRLEFAVVLTESLPEVHADRGMCRHILQNLVANAVKFTHQGRVEIRADVASGRLRIAVADTGIGIAPELHQVVFEEFRQADESTARQYGGTGLGLTIARRYATLLGATLELSSVPGQGSTFTLCLPFAPKP